MLDRYISQAYNDKLAGDLPEEIWRTKNSTWRVEQEKLKAEMNTFNTAKQDYIENGVLLIELAKRFADVYFAADARAKRQLIELVSSNRILRNGSLRYE